MFSRSPSEMFPSLSPCLPPRRRLPKHRVRQLDEASLGKRRSDRDYLRESRVRSSSRDSPIESSRPLPPLSTPCCLYRGSRIRDSDSNKEGKRKKASALIALVGDRGSSPSLLLPFVSPFPPRVTKTSRSRHLPSIATEISVQTTSADGNGRLLCS